MINLYDGNNIMRRQYEKTTGSPILDMRRRFELMASEPVGQNIWVWDGFNHNARRREIYPKYKTNRLPTPEDVYAQIKLWKDVMKHTNAIQIEVTDWEADDVISTMAKKLSASGVAVAIHTNDMDYAQLQGLPHITLQGVNTKDVPARWVPLYKAMVGDTSDNIDGIPGFGPKRWVEMEPYWTQIERAVVNGHPSGFEGMPFKPKVAGWLTDEKNIELLQQMLMITYFYPVPDDEISGGIHRGQLDYKTGSDKLRTFFI